MRRVNRQYSGTIEGMVLVSALGAGAGARARCRTQPLAPWPGCGHCGVLVSGRLGRWLGDAQLENLDVDSGLLGVLGEHTAVVEQQLLITHLDVDRTEAAEISVQRPRLGVAGIVAVKERGGHVGDPLLAENRVLAFV